ncbi:molybdopterin-dependent oxidoreductase [Desulfobacula sp.]|uniref:molybdopterin-dependent oxidoreductase n=1 Tax=Desulfobacula sp. TaxID=2593537 RepID=UPI00262A2514|nr:molybdopterin-dependent oxidoreductase [Desulfobacula sp.]
MENNKLSRREFMALSGGALVQIGLPGTFVKLSHAANDELADQLRPDGRPRLPPGQMAVESIQPMGGISGPGLDPKWQLQIKGEVKKSTIFKWDDLMKFPQTDLICDVHCVTGWTLLDSRWQGIRLSHLMDAVDVSKKGTEFFLQKKARTTYRLSPVFQMDNDHRLSLSVRVFL